MVKEKKIGGHLKAACLIRLNAAPLVRVEIPDNGGRAPMFVFADDDDRATRALAELEKECERLQQKATAQKRSEWAR